MLSRLKRLVPLRDTVISENLVTFGESDYDQKQAEGFINLWGLPTKVLAYREKGLL